MPIKIRGTRLVYFPVPKIACTSIKTAIHNHNLGSAAADAAGNGKLDVHGLYESQEFRLKYLLHYFGRDWFCVVRDPVKRFVSGYRNRILHHGDLGHGDDPIFERLGLPHRPDINEFALNLGTYSREFRAIGHHFSPICTYLGNRPWRFARVFDISQMEELKDYVRAAGADLEIPHEQAGGPKMTAADLTDDARAAVEQFYASDYRVWGRYF